MNDSAPGVLAQRPAHRVGDGALAVLGGVDLPDFLHAEAEFLRVSGPSDRSYFAITCFDSDCRARLRTGRRTCRAAPSPARRTGPGVPSAVAAELARDDARDRRLLAIDQRRAGHAGEDLDAQRLGLLGHPAADIGHADDVVAVVRHQRRHRPVRDADLPRRAEDVEVVLASPATLIGASIVRQSGSSASRPDGSSTAPDRICAPTSDPFSSTTTDRSGIELLQPDRRRQARGAGAHDHHVIVHRSRARSRSSTCPILRRSARAMQCWLFPCPACLSPMRRSTVTSIMTPAIPVPRCGICTATATMRRVPPASPLQLPVRSGFR